jgi:hypothetical protein
MFGKFNSGDEADALFRTRPMGRHILLVIQLPKLGLPIAKFIGGQVESLYFGGWHSRRGARPATLFRRPSDRDVALARTAYSL